ncbi:MAG: hypothetical protein KatS3mg031_2766 [Chitinophagales bacterium]|nr:MAG: hypothetical protein KatS3mg031_2766 [Chitinophagales bacterium]
MHVFVGTQITQPADPLRKIRVEELIQQTAHPKTGFHEFILQLRALRSIDPQRYRQQKTRLPYFTCGHFHPPVRKKENFAAIELFVIDLDHLPPDVHQAASLRQQLQADERVLALFTSPGGDGLKILFRLNQPCKDSALFSAFYKTFVAHLGVQYRLSGLIDLRTSDVTRACFISTDPDAYFNPACAPVNLQQYINPLDYSASETTIKEAEKQLQELAAPAPTAPPLTDDVLQAIKHKLNPNFRPPSAKQYYLPPEVDHILPVVTESLRKYGIEVTETAPIHYGRKIKVKAGNHWAEINIFYGKKGYSLVKTPKSGSNAQLADMAWQILYEHLITGQSL